MAIVCPSLLFLKIYPPSFGFPNPKFFLKSFDIFKILVPHPILKGREHTMAIYFQRVFY